MTIDTRARFLSVLERVGAAAEAAGRSRDDVTLVVVSKGQGPEAVLQAILAGATDLGENRAQELRQKHAVIGSRAHWHFIGHLQTNKVRYVVGASRLVHSVDRYGLAEAIARRASVLGLEQEILVEVNVAREAAKDGVEVPRAIELAEEVDAMEGVRVRGLMTMAPFSDDPERSRPYFGELRGLSQRLRQSLPQATELSMGMSGDFEVAIEEGATIVRVGTAIFGPRAP